MKNYITIWENAETEIEEKKSRFIGHAFYVETVKEAENKISQIKKKYFDARHNCYAYRVIDNGIKTKSSDDGEPSGTAGAPILNILTKQELCNVLVIVTRYFGGTLLGTGGLIRAYSSATIEAIQKAELAVQENGEEMEIVIPYKDLEKFKYYCNKNNITILNTIYEKDIKCIIELNNEEKEKIIRENKKSFEILQYNSLKEKYIKKRIKT